MTYMPSRPEATATVSLPAAPATDSAARVRVEEVQAAAELVWAEMDSLAWSFRKNRFYCSGSP